eukprot:6205664-Pleurochrysis_carterae.AAC.6
MATLHRTERVCTRQLDRSAFGVCVSGGRISAGRSGVAVGARAPLADRLRNAPFGPAALVCARKCRNNFREVRHSLCSIALHSCSYFERSCNVRRSTVGSASWARPTPWSPSSAIRLRTSARTLAVHIENRLPL